MSDVRKALEAAEVAMGLARMGMVVGDIDFGADENDGRDDLIVRAAVLAFLRAMPDLQEPDMTDPGWTSGYVNTPSRIVAAIEAEDGE